MSRSQITKLLICMLCLCVLVIQSDLKAQNVVIHSIDIKDGDVKVSYSLIDRNVNNRYALYLYSSLDNYEKPLQKVDGEIGLDLKAGNNKKLVWHASEEFGKRFKGDVSLKIKGDLYSPFMELNNFGSIEKITRKQSTWITWAADSTISKLTLELFNKNREFVYMYTDIKNEGRYELIIPGSIRPGEGYYFMIYDQDNEKNVIKTPKFQIIRKNPNAMKIVLITTGILGVGGYFAYEYLLKDSESVQPDTGFGDPVLPSN